MTVERSAQDEAMGGLGGFIRASERMVARFPPDRSGTRRFVLAFCEDAAHIRLQDLTNPLRFFRQMEGNPPRQWGTEGFRDNLVDDSNPARHYAAFLFAGFWLPSPLAILLLWVWEFLGYIRYGFRWSLADIRSGYVGIFHGQLIRMNGHMILPSLLTRDLSQR